MPCNGTIEDVRWIPGRFYPQNETALQHIPSVYERNERAVLRVRAEDGRELLLVMVGASLIGGIHLQALPRGDWIGLRATPMLAGGQVPLTLQLLSPAHRPVQVTRDLSSFWARGYAEVKKELKGRYPKHYWPDDPLTAQPTARTKKRM
jgi:hypothetical protein